MSKSSVELARQIRVDVLKMVHRAKAAHVGSSLSSCDILAALYSDILQVRPSEPKWADRDRLIYSKGHAAAALFAVLAERGFFSKGWLDEYCSNGSPLMGHVSHHVPGVEFSTGSLGHGMPLGCGLALSFQRQKKSQRVFVIVSDGELDEGSNWEAILFAGHHRLDPLTMIVDYNKIQSFGSVQEVLELDPLADKFRAFHWDVIEVDGHDHDQLQKALKQRSDKKPRAVIAHTIKGKGVSFMEGQLLWHYRSPSDDDLGKALAELGERA